jgi:hypothetical protein
MAGLGLGKKKDEEPEDNLVDIEEVEVVEEPVVEEPEVHPAVAAARDGARVCLLINMAVQNASALLGGRGTEEELQEVKDEASRCAARAAGTWMAIENEVLPVQLEAAQRVGLFADENSLAEMTAAVIIAARDELQLILGKVDPESDLKPADSKSK